MLHLRLVADFFTSDKFIYQPRMQQNSLLIDPLHFCHTARPGTSRDLLPPVTF